MHFTRSSAFVAHLIISLLVFSTLVLTMYFFWFPGELFFLDGGLEGLKLVAMVDLVLGPLLTILLIKPGKKKKLIAIDLSMIALLQLTALAYGFYTTYHQHTAAIVFAENKFNTLSIASQREANAELVKRELTPTSLDLYGSQPYPYHIYTVKPVGQSMGRYVADLLNGYPEAHERSDKYLAIADHYNEMRQDRLQKEELKEEGSWKVIATELHKHNHSIEKFDLYPFRARYASGVAVFNPSTMRIVDYIKLDRDEFAAIAKTQADNPEQENQKQAQSEIN